MTPQPPLDPPDRDDCQQWIDSLPVRDRQEYADRFVRTHADLDVQFEGWLRGVYARLQAEAREP